MNNEKEDNNKSEVNKQPEVPENQTARNSDNQGIKETVNQTSQTGKTGGPRGPEARQQTMRAGLAERTWGEAVDHVGRAGCLKVADCRQG